MTVLPNGYLTISEAGDVLAQAMHAGVPDLPDVSKLRKRGFDAKDGPAVDRAIAELWKAVDGYTVRALAVGGRPRRILKLKPSETKSVPTLRSPRGTGFSALRQSNPMYEQLAGWFGPSAHTAVLAFRETEVQKLARKLMRTRRTVERRDGQQKSRGRPSRIKMVQAMIIEVIAQRKWSPTKGMKALIRTVNRAGKLPKEVSQDTVIRAFDLLHEQTKDRRYERVRVARKPRRK